MVTTAIHDQRPKSLAVEWICAGYLAAQAVVGVVFWVTLESLPAVREWLELMPSKHEVTDAFVLADAIVIVGSAVSAWAVARGKRWSLPVVAFTAGGVVYPTLFLVCWVALTGVGAATLAVMVAPSSLTCWVTYQVWRADR
jgi:hypothetical protein